VAGRPVPVGAGLGRRAAIPHQDSATLARTVTGEGAGRTGRGRQRAQNDTDPLGRPMHGRRYGDDTTVKVPGEAHRVR